MHSFVIPVTSHFALLMKTDYSIELCYQSVTPLPPAASLSSTHTPRLHRARLPEQIDRRDSLLQMPRTKTSGAGRNTPTMMTDGAV